MSSDEDKGEAVWCLCGMASIMCVCVYNHIRSYGDHAWLSVSVESKGGIFDMFKEGCLFFVFLFSDPGTKLMIYVTFAVDLRNLEVLFYDVKFYRLVPF